MQEQYKLLAELFYCAVRNAHPGYLMASHLPQPPKGRTVVVGGGKAAAAMAQALDTAWAEDVPLSGAVVTRYGHTPPQGLGKSARITIYESAHPVPDMASVAGATTMLELVRDLGEDDLVICLMSGGASSLLALPIDGISLADKQEITRRLLMSGASIEEMNVVRQSLSRIKGGQLADACGAAPVLTLAISDVPGDRPDIIGSGPTIPQLPNARAALGILQRRRIDVPKNVRDAILSHDGARLLANPRCSLNDKVQLMATPSRALKAAAQRALELGYRAYVLSDSIEGESREVARFHADIARSVREGKSTMERPCVILSGGETTVTVTNTDGRPGRGGRAGEFCLGLAVALNGSPDIWALAADTDGIDGSELNAGAFVSPDTLARAEVDGLSMDDCMRRHDSYSFFEAIGDVLVTGPTYTNVNDFRAILIA